MVKENLQKMAALVAICSLSPSAMEVAAAPTRIMPTWFDTEFPVAQTDAGGQTQLQWFSYRSTDDAQKGATDRAEAGYQAASTRISDMSGVFLTGDAIREAMAIATTSVLEIEPMRAEATIFKQLLSGLEWQPAISYQPDEVVFEWAANGRRAIASLEGDGFLAYTMLVDGRFVPGKEEAAKITSLPDDLHDYLTNA